MRPAALIVEDNPYIRKVLVQVLQQHGYRTCEAASEKAAVELLETFLFDLIIVDTDLCEGPKGIELLARHKYLSPKAIRVLLSTRFQSDDVRKLLCDEINAFFVEKPEILTQLIGQIERLIKKSPGDLTTRRRSPKKRLGRSGVTKET